MLCLVFQSPSDHRRLVRCDGIGRFGAPQAGLMNVLRLMSTHLCDHLFLSSQRRTLLRPRVTRLPVAHNVHMAFDSMKAACYCGSASCYELQILAHGRVLVQCTLLTLSGPMTVAHLRLIQTRYSSFRTKKDFTVR